MNTKQSLAKRIGKGIWGLKGYVITIAVLYLLFTFIFAPVMPNGTSMEQSISNGDVLLMERVIYKLSGLNRFDIVVFHNEAEDRDLIKRVIALPGEKIRIDEEGEIYINGEHLIEAYGFEKMEVAGLAATEITLADDEIFVLGDNRNNSEDSRYIGPVKMSDVAGRCYLRVMPLDKFGYI